MKAQFLALALAFAAGCSKCRPDEPAPEHADAALAPLPAATNRALPRPTGFMKGQLHTHSSGSGDSHTPPLDVQRWYEARGYDFLVFTDHNHITDTPDSTLLTIPGAELTRNLRTCDPPAPFGVQCAFHMNVLFATAPPGNADPGDTSSNERLANYRVELARAKSLGGIAMLNHPNMMSGADATIVSALAAEGLLLLEVGNQAWDAQNDGDPQRKSTEAIWDEVLASGKHVFATITDDAHQYADAAEMRARGEEPFGGDLGFVVVHADKNANAIRAAIEDGDFYGSTGVVFETYARTATSLTLATKESVFFEAIGRNGSVSRRERGTRFELMLRPEDGPYVRARVKREDGSAIALTQPLFRATAK